MSRRPTRAASGAIRAALRGHEPSEEQWLAISHDPVPVAIIAGAGSGKTAIMAARMVWMVEQHIAAPSEILGLTFTNKAAAELEERIVQAFAELGRTYSDFPNVATYNSFADRIVRQHGVRIGIDPEVGLLSQGQSWQLVRDALADVPAFEWIDSRSLSSLCQSALALAEHCANHCVTPEEVAAQDLKIVDEEAGLDPKAVLASRRRIELTGLVRAYMERKRAGNRIDYGDQVAKAVEILESFPEVCLELRERYPAILLDEYQDTNVAQRRMLQPLAPEGSNITAVGDARQNIFQWRGSTLFNLIDFPARHFLRRGGRTHEYLSLSANFRSGSAILEAANVVIDPIPSDRRPGRPLAALPENKQGFVGTTVLADQMQEAAFIAEEIKRLHGRPAGEGRRPSEWRDFAILVRRKSHLGPIYSALRTAEIPVEVIGLGGLLQLPEVMDLVAWLRVIADPGPESNRWLARILMGPRFRIHPRDLALLARWAAENTAELKASKTGGPAEHEAVVPDETALEPDEVAFSLQEAFDHLDEIESLPAEAVRRLTAACAEINALRENASTRLLQLVQSVVWETGIGESLLASPRADAGAALANLNQFLGIVADFDPVAGDPSLTQFLDYLDAAEQAADTFEMQVPSSEDSVKLTTVHRAKGLEFEVVFVPGVAARENEDGVKVDSLFPDERTTNPLSSYSELPYGVREDRAHLPLPWTPGPGGRPVLKKKEAFTKELKQRAVEDERRLFYVAVTRAKQRLYVSAAWWYERQGKPRGPSVFFDQVAAAECSTDLGKAERPEASPLAAELKARAVWPPALPFRLHHPELPEGHPAALQALLDGRLSAESLLERLDDAARRRACELLDGHRAMLAGIKPERPSLPVPLKSSISVTQAVELVCDPASYEDINRPRLEPPSQARRIGTEIHRWIEEQGRGLTGLADEEALDAPAAGVPPARLAELKRSFAAMGYEQKAVARLDSGEPMAEVPFVIKMGSFLLRGRIDAVYRDEAGGLEIVDFKSGTKTEQPSIDQLILYAAALAKLGIHFGKAIALTFCYLSTGERVTRRVSVEEALAALEALRAKLAGVLAG